MRLAYIDGLKGLSAIIVLLTHFVLAFPDLDFLRDIPIVNLFFNGRMAVYIFVFLSAYCICISLDKADFCKAAANVALKRYFRLTLPLVFPTLLAFLCAFGGMTFNVQAGTMDGSFWLRDLIPSHPTFRMLMSGIAVGVIKGSALINPLWMMGYIFLGTYLVIPLFLVAKKISSQRLVLLFLFLQVVLFSSLSSYYVTTVLGVLLYFVRNSPSFKHWSVGCICLVVFLVANLTTFEYYELVMAVCFVIGSMNVRWIQRVLSIRPLAWINAISYQLYMVHATVIATICSYAFLNLPSMGVALRYLALFVLFVVVSMIIAALFSRIDRFVSKKMDNIYHKTLL